MAIASHYALVLLLNPRDRNGDTDSRLELRIPHELNTLDLTPGTRLLQSARCKAPLVLVFSSLPFLKVFQLVVEETSNDWRK